MPPDLTHGRPASTCGVPLHTRSLTVSVKRCAEERWLARGDVIDLRKNGFVPTSYDIQPAGVIHSMNLELELDPTTLRIEAIRVDQPFVAVEPSEVTGGECCRDPAPRLLDLAGECLDDEFAAKLSAQFGGPLGCSHLLTLFQLMASAVPHAARVEHARAEREGTQHRLNDRFFRRAVFIDGLRQDDGRIDAAVAFSDSITRPLGPDLDTLGRLERFHEVKLAATVERTRFLLERFDLRERSRGHTSLAATDWADLTPRFASLVGAPMIPGLAKRIFGLTQDAPELHAAKDTLLMLAPGFIQVLAALMDNRLEEHAAARERGEDTGSAEVMNHGGGAGACYMWRENGPISMATFSPSSRE